MSNEGGAPKKLSTAEILARARAEKAAKSAASNEAESSIPQTSPGSTSPGSTSPGPESTSSSPDIASSGAAAAVPATTTPSAAAKPKSTAEILAAARAAAAAKSSSAASPTAATSSSAKAAAPESADSGTGAKPKSTADILASARAAAAAKASGTEGTASSAASGATAGSPQKTPVPAKPSGPKPSVQEMLAAVRSSSQATASTATPASATAGTAVAASAAKAVPVAAPPMPAKPAPPASKKSADSASRRTFIESVVVTILSPFWIAWASFAAATVASTLAMLRFMLPNVLTEPPSKFKVGPPSDYDLGTVSEKWKAQFGIWIVHTDKYQGKNLIYALSTVCTHLGCTPSWLDGEQKYKCPCHGSGFYINGINFEGPAPRPLERVGIRLAEDGMLEVDKSLKFQEEMGQWNDAASFVEVGV